MDTLLGARILAPDGGGDGAIRTSVSKYYGETLKSSADLKTSACCTPANQIPKAVRDALKLVPDEVKAKYYGCGSPTPVGIEGLRVLDLGSGSGRDCFVAAKLVGESGSVVGVDMTDEQLSVARKHADAYCVDALGYSKSNVTFYEGTIEDLNRLRTAEGESTRIESSSVDLIISNCVINLSPDKKAVLSEAHRVLADGGEFFFSDVYCDRRLPEDLRAHEILLGECLGGAMYIEDFKRLCHRTGFADPRVLAGHAIEITDEKLADALGEAKFYSLTYRLFKLPEGRLESLCEDYGQYAVYKGTIEGNPHAYALDDHHRLETNKPFLVCGNTASMLSETWLGKHFAVHGDRSVHYGLFDCGPSPVGGGGAAPASGGCC
jgi:SAM-dependent methyltransferase